MRFRLLATSCLLVAVSAGGVKTLAASPDCARWVKEYQQGLAKRAAGAKRHVVRAARHLGVPHTRLVHASVPVHRLHPAKLRPQEMLKRFRVLCGEDLPEDAVPVAFVPTGLEAMMVPPAPPVEAVPVTELGQPVTFTPATSAVTPQENTPGNGIGFNPTPPVVVASGGVPPGSTTTDTGTGTTPVVTPNVPVVTPSPVPEPSSLLLLLTGAAGAVPLLRRRVRV